MTTDAELWLRPGRWEAILYAEIIPTPGWSRKPKIGRTWKRRPDEHAGRLVKIRLLIPDNFLTEYDVVATIDVPEEAPPVVDGTAVLE